jgi:hypothetical protein
MHFAFLHLILWDQHLNFHAAVALLNERWREITILVTEEWTVRAFAMEQSSTCGKSITGLNHAHEGVCFG